MAPRARPVWNVVFTALHMEDDIQPFKRRFTAPSLVLHSCSFIPVLHIILFNHPIQHSWLQSRVQWTDAKTPGGGHFTYAYSTYVTRVRTERWSTGSTALGCPASAAGWPGTLRWGNPQTCCRCSRWPAASWGPRIKVRYGDGDINEPMADGRAHQLLLSTASPKPGVSTMVSRSCTPPSLTRTLDCSTCTDQQRTH